MSVTEQHAPEAADAQTSESRLCTAAPGVAVVPRSGRLRARPGLAHRACGYFHTRGSSGCCGGELRAHLRSAVGGTTERRAVRPGLRGGLIAAGVAAALAGAVAAGSAMASEHQRPKPTARQLWQEYPLNTPAPRPQRRARTRGAEAKAQAARPSASSTSNSSQRSAGSGSDVRRLLVRLVTGVAFALALLVLTFFAIGGGGRVTAAFARGVYASTGGATRKAGTLAAVVPRSTLFWCLGIGALSAGIGIVAFLLA